MITRLDDHKDQAGAWDVLEAASGKLALDVGANIGQSTAVLAAHFDRVVALEPCVESFAILDAEMSDNVERLGFAASAFCGELRLTESARSIATGQLTTGSGLAWGKTIGERLVPSVTLDQLILTYGQPDFVKIDTEGHEVEVLRGWTGPKCSVLIEVHSANNEAECRSLMGVPLRKLTHDPAVGEMALREHFWLTNG